MVYIGVDGKRNNNNLYIPGMCVLFADVLAHYECYRCKCTVVVE